MFKAIYNPRQIETEPLERRILVHSAMLYECVVCKTVYQFWLEKGLEDRKQDKIEPEKHKPVPFTTPCLCGGTASHIAWDKDIELDDYRLLEEDENYFENTEEYDYGVSHIRNKGLKQKIVIPNIAHLQDVLEEERKERRQKEYAELKQASSCDEDDPYGLAHISTSKLKAELRRRKRW